MRTSQWEKSRVRLCEAGVSEAGKSYQKYTIQCETRIVIVVSGAGLIREPFQTIQSQACMRAP